MKLFPKLPELSPVGLLFVFFILFVFIFGFFLEMVTPMLLELS